MTTDTGGPRPAPGRIVLVATPIGNLDDLSPRAARALEEADVVAAEDTRRSRTLLERVGSRAPMLSYHDHNETRRGEELVRRAEAGETVVVVSDAGTPGLADPGFEVVRLAVERGVPVESVPGPSAALQALVLSGLPMDRFVFEGFLPRKAGARLQRLREIAADPRTTVFYVAPHRAAEDLAAMAEVLGDRRAALARELTKLHEEVWRGDLPALAARAATQGVRGEVTVVVAGAPAHPVTAVDLRELGRRVESLVAEGVPRKEAAAAVADAAGVAKRAVYDASLAARSP